MGSSLRRQLREALPPSIKGLQRAVALEIADDARYDDAWNYNPENGRRSKARLADIVRWTAAKDELSVREMLRRLSLAGWEFRVPIGKDKNGNVMYAVPGRAMTFRVPDFEGPTVVGPYVETEVEGPTVVGGRANQGWGMAQPPLGEGPTTVGAGPTTVGPPSPVSSFSTKESPSSSPVAEDAPKGPVEDSDGTEGGGGGEIESSEDQEQDEPLARAEAFVGSLTYRPGKPPRKKQRQQIITGVVAAFKAGWTENGLRRYLDCSDDPNARSAAALYEYRLREDELPPSSDESTLPPVCDQHMPDAATDVSLRVHPITGDPCPRCHPSALLLPPACDLCLRANSGAATDVRLRRNQNSFIDEPCPDCHPATVGRETAESVPACQACIEENPAAEFNIRFRYRVIDGEHQGCPDCHPKRIVILKAHQAARDTADGGMWERAMSRATARNGDVLPGDRNALGWYQLSRQLGAKEKRPQPGRNYSNDVWQQPANPVQAAKIPHCGNPNCDPVTRLKTAPDWTGEAHTSLCGDCHPSLKLG